jgi:hypothetical protein
MDEIDMVRAARPSVSVVDEDRLEAIRRSALGTSRTDSPGSFQPIESEVLDSLAPARHRRLIATAAVVIVAVIGVGLSVRDDEPSPPVAVRNDPAPTTATSFASPTTAAVTTPQRTPLSPGCDRGASRGPRPDPDAKAPTPTLATGRMTWEEADALQIGDTVRAPLPWSTDRGIDDQVVPEWLPMTCGTGQIVGFIPKAVQYQPPRTAANGPPSPYSDTAVYDKATGAKVGWVTDDGFHSLESGYRPSTELRLSMHGEAEVGPVNIEPVSRPAPSDPPVFALIPPEALPAGDGASVDTPNFDRFPPFLPFVGSNGAVVGYVRTSDVAQQGAGGYAAMNIYDNDLQSVVARVDPAVGGYIGLIDRTIGLKPSADKNSLPIATGGTNSGLPYLNTDGTTAYVIPADRSARTTNDISTKPGGVVVFQDFAEMFDPEGLAQVPQLNLAYSDGRGSVVRGTMPAGDPIGVCKASGWQRKGCVSADRLRADPYARDFIVGSTNVTNS